jgi:membrane-associated phospholipid phosphatase
LIRYIFILLLTFATPSNLFGQLHNGSLFLYESGSIGNHFYINDKYPLIGLKSNSQLFFFNSLNLKRENISNNINDLNLSNCCLNFNNDSVNNVHFYKSYLPSIVLMTGGLLTLRADGFLNKVSIQKSFRSEFPANFHTNADNYLQFVPIPVVYLMDLTRFKPEHTVVHRTILLASAEIFMEGIAQVLKYSTHEQRPDGSNYYSFPSGHTAQAFLAAAFMQKELGKRSIWFTIGAYSCATAVGMLRMANNRHYISDVLFGAGLGILSINAVYDLDTFYLRKVKVK